MHQFTLHFLVLRYSISIHFDGAIVLFIVPKMATFVLPSLLATSVRSFGWVAVFHIPNWYHCKAEIAECLIIRERGIIIGLLLTHRIVINRFF